MIFAVGGVKEFDLGVQGSIHQDYNLIQNNLNFRFVKCHASKHMNPQIQAIQTTDSIVILTPKPLKLIFESPTSCSKTYDALISMYHLTKRQQTALYLILLNEIIYNALY